MTIEIHVKQNELNDSRDYSWKIWTEIKLPNIQEGNMTQKEQLECFLMYADVVKLNYENAIKRKLELL